MISKKTLMTVSASAVIAATFVVTDEADASAYKVKSGDTLWDIAHHFDIGVSTLKSINHLKGDIIYPNQVLQTTSIPKVDTEKKKHHDTVKEDTKHPSSNASTYTVKRGDTLSEIAFKHNVSVTDLMKWNDLHSTLIYPGNVFVLRPDSDKSEVDVSGEKDKPKKHNSKPPKDKVAAESIYVVKSGDSLSKIAYQYGVKVSELRNWNGLHSNFLSIGQKIKIGGSKVSSSTHHANKPAEDSTAHDNTSNTSYNVQKLISTAKSLKGIPYVWGGQSLSGFDCSGFIYYTYKKAGMNMGRQTSDGYFNRSHYVSKPKPGDLVFFKNTYRKGISHLGIYLGNNKFINASSHGVSIANVNGPYWKQHFDSFKRFY